MILCKACNVFVCATGHIVLIILEDANGTAYEAQLQRFTEYCKGVGVESMIVVGTVHREGCQEIESSDIVDFNNSL